MTTTPAERADARRHQDALAAIRAARGDEPSKQSYGWAIGEIEAAARIALSQDLDARTALAGIIELCQAARGAA